MCGKIRLRPRRRSPLGSSCSEGKGQCKPIKFLTSPVSGRVTYSNVTPVSGRPWVSVHQENQPYARVSISPRVPGSPVFVMGRFLSTPEPVYPIWVLCHVHCNRKVFFVFVWRGGWVSQVPEKGSAPPLSTELLFPRMGFPFSRPTHPQLLPLQPRRPTHCLRVTQRNSMVTT